MSVKRPYFGFSPDLARASVETWQNKRQNWGIKLFQSRLSAGIG